MKHRFILAGAFACALAAAGCQTIDTGIAAASDKLSARCADLQTAALVVDLFAPEKVRAAAAQGQVVLAQFCAKPPRTAADLAIAIGETMKALQAIEAAKRG